MILPARPQVVSSQALRLLMKQLLCRSFPPPGTLLAPIGKRIGTSRVPGGGSKDCHATIWCNTLFWSLAEIILASLGKGTWNCNRNSLRFLSASVSHFHSTSLQHWHFQHVWPQKCPTDINHYYSIHIVQKENQGLQEDPLARLPKWIIPLAEVGRWFLKAMPNSPWCHFPKSAPQETPVWHLTLIVLVCIFPSICTVFASQPWQRCFIPFKKTENILQLSFLWKQNTNKGVLCLKSPVSVNDFSFLQTI